MSGENQIAIRDEDIFKSIDKWSPGHLTELYQGNARQFEAWKQDAALAIIENKDLRACLGSDDGKISLIRAMQRSATSGLSLNPQKGESALVPINGKVNFWPMKNGISKKALETGSLEHIEANTIFLNDTFQPKKTARGDDYEFIPALKDRGPPAAYFAVAVLKSGRSVVEYWTKGQVEEHKKKYGKGTDKDGSAWNRNFDGMAEKTVLKALLSGLHLPKAVTDLLEADNAAEQTEARNVTEPPAGKGTSAEELAKKLDGEPEPEGEPDTPPSTPAAGPAKPGGALF